MEDTEKRIKEFMEELENDCAFLKRKWEETGSRLVCGQWSACDTIAIRFKEMFMEELE